VVTTIEGDRLISYARRLLEINNEAIMSLTEPLYDLSITFGVPGDLVHPFVPNLFSKLNESYPRLGVKMESDFTHFLRRGLKNGLYDVILTTERVPGDGGEVLLQQPLVWMSRPGGSVHQRRPLPIALSHNCMFRKPAMDALDEAGIQWVDIVQSMNDEAALVYCAADLGLRVEMPCSGISGIGALEEGHGLPELPMYSVVIYFSPGLSTEISDEFLKIAKTVFSQNSVQ